MQKSFENDLLDYCEPIFASDTLEQKFGIWSDKISRFGFRSSLYGFSPIAKRLDDFDLADHTQVISSYHPEVVGLYKSAKGLTGDVSLQSTFHSNDDYLWEAAHDLYTRGEMSAESRYIHEVTADHEIDVGVTITIEASDRIGYAGMGLCHDPKQPLDAFSAFWANCRREVCTVDFR